MDKGYYMWLYNMLGEKADLGFEELEMFVSKNKDLFIANVSAFKNDKGKTIRELDILKNGEFVRSFAFDERGVCIE